MSRSGSQIVAVVAALSLATPSSSYAQRLDEPRNPGGTGAGPGGTGGGPGYVPPRPPASESYSTPGTAFSEEELLNARIAIYTRAIARNPKDADAYTKRGNAYAKKGDKDKAIADFRKAFEINPSLQEAKDALEDLGVTP